MEHNTNRILWTVLVLAIGVALYVGFKGPVNGLLGQVTEKIQTVATNVHGDTNDSSNGSNSNSNTTVKPNLLINTSSSATNGKTILQGASPQIYGVYSRTDSYEQVTTPDLYNELFYRFMNPDPNNLHGLTPGATYTLSGSASHTTGELMFRSQYSKDKSTWSSSDISDLKIPVSDGSVFTPFSYTFTIPTNATGVYCSLQNYDYTDGSLFRFTNMKLVKE